MSKAIADSIETQWRLQQNIMANINSNLQNMFNSYLQQTICFWPFNCQRTY